MRQVESSHVVAGVLEVIRARRRPRLHFEVELLRAHNQWLAPALSALGPPAKRDADAVDAKPREPLDRLQHGVVVPTENLIDRRRVPEIMRARAFVNEMEWMLPVHAHNARPPGVPRCEAALF